jgi:hypothetical protein
VTKELNSQFARGVGRPHKETVISCIDFANFSLKGPRIDLNPALNVMNLFALGYASLPGSTGLYSCFDKIHAMTDQVKIQETVQTEGAVFRSASPWFYALRGTR